MEPSAPASDADASKSIYEAVMNGLVAAERSTGCVLKMRAGFRGVHGDPPVQGYSPSPDD
jgi:hypothetical protein